MSTRSTVKFFSEFGDNKCICAVRHQFDGYIKGVGHDLAEFLKDKKVINGISTETIAQGYANGVGCLAAQYVAANKTVIGGVYMTSDDDTDEYNYEVRLKDNSLVIKVDEIFEGTPEELLNFQEK